MSSGWVGTSDSNASVASAHADLRHSLFPPKNLRPVLERYEFVRRSPQQTGKNSLIPEIISGTTAIVSAQEKSYPPIIASLLPKNATVISGQYFPGDYSSGDGSADLSYSFENPGCVNTVYSSRISIAFKSYGGELAILIKSDESPYGTVDRDAIREQFITDATNELARTSMTPVKETVGIGEVVYVEYKTECHPAGQADAAARIGPIIVPNIKLRGVAWSGGANIEVKLEGPISTALARAAVAEVFENLKKTDFSKVE